MLLGLRAFFFLGVSSISLLSACGSSSSGTSRGSEISSSGTGNTAGYLSRNPLGGGGIAETSNAVVATPSVAGIVSVVVGAKQAVSITFTSRDGRAIAGFGVSGSLLTLPTGWSGPGGFTCASVSIGKGCVLNLTYAPVAFGSGTLTVDYVFVDNAFVDGAAAPKTGGSLTIAYRATTNDQIVGTPSKNALDVVTGSKTAIKVTFDTDDGHPARGLSVPSGLGALPGGWASTFSTFTCSKVGAGTGCQLDLTYAPTVIASGTLSLNYRYSDDSGTAKTGSVSIPYAARSPPHLYVGQLRSPSLYYCVLNVDGTLAGCTATGGTGFGAPTGIVFNGNNFAYVADWNNHAVYLCNVGLDGSLSGCSSTGSHFSSPWQLAINGTTLYATNADPTGGVTTCSINGDGSLSGCNEGSGSGTSGIAAGSSYVYIGVGVSTVDVCAIGVSGSLVGCTPTGNGFSGVDGISLSGSYAYIANQGNGTTSVCSIDTDGSLSLCVASISGVSPTDVVINGNQAYVNDAIAPSGNIYLCSIGPAGVLTGCGISNGGTSFSYGVQIAVH